MNQSIIEQIIIKKCLLNNYPKKDVAFLSVEALFDDYQTRELVSKAVLTATKELAFDSVAGIASRGFLFSGMIANQSGEKGELLIQKVKSKGDARFVQKDASTEYSSDALQILKGTVQKGKKYLLTDDLIATGGSIMTAIQLIRDCGGEVDTVLVMTELVDFNTRAMLKEAGVELVSLLQFTSKDLQKLMLIQKCYDANSPAPITYQLSQHAQGEHAFNQTQLNVHLASSSPVKKEATQLVCQGLFDPLTIEMIEHEGISGVSRQPSGYEETRRGAMNRLAGMIYPDSSSAIGVSIENGLRYSEDDKCYYDFVHVAVKQGDKTVHHTQDCCTVPMELIEQRDQDNQETWGETARRLGLAQHANDPHQDVLFGGVSRTEHLFRALSKALGALKSELMKDSTLQMEDVNAWVTLNDATSQSKLAKRNIFFTAPKSTLPAQPIDLYNHGCQRWNPEKADKTDFKIFSTGDAFSILSPDLKIKKSPVIVHVGLEHAQYSPMVLLYEALQLCRSAHEHGAQEITVALPKQFHPVIHQNDFNQLLLRLFKASGANKVYFYDETYAGTLEGSKSHYQITSDTLLNSLKASATSEASLDAQVMQRMRSSYLEGAFAKFGVDHKEMFRHSAFHPEIKEAPHVLLCCSANKPLAQKIAESMRARGERVTIYDIQGKGEQALIPEEASICGATVTIVQSTRPNPDQVAESMEYQINGGVSYFFETVMIARQAHLRGAAKINLINPYQFNARSDKAEDNSRGKTGAYVQHNGELLKAAGINQLVTSECHDPHTLSGTYTGKRIQSSAIPALTVIAKKIAMDWLNNPDHPMKGQLRLVTPDAGATKRTNELTQKLQSILGKKLCESRVLGEKQRSSHADNSAVIDSMSSGTVGINADDKYLITDDETATGSTLCQAIVNLKKNGAEDIAVIVVHNNMPLDWMIRQLCLARFLYLGATDLHFSDTQEMGTLAKSYEDMIHIHAQKSLLSRDEIEAQAFSWFKSNLGGNRADKSELVLAQEFSNFKSMFEQFNTKITVHSLADKFAHRVMPLATEYSMETASSNGMLFFSPRAATSTNSVPASSYSIQAG